MIIGGKRRLQIIISSCTLLFVLLFAILNIGLSIEPTKEFMDKKITFSEYIDKIQTSYTSDEFFLKNQFVNMNGLFARLTGKVLYNKTVLTTNGMLATTSGKRDITPNAGAVIDFKEYLDKKGIHFLYVQIPCKEDFDDQIYPNIISSYGNENADEMLAALKSAGVKTIDVRSKISVTPESLKEYFYSTDHHWNSRGAFVAFQELMQELILIFPDRGIDLTYADADNWKEHTLKKWFLGSQGKRVGQYFVGTDDLVWHTPLFDTDMSCIVPKLAKLYKGDYITANIREKYIEEKDYFNYSAYCVNIGGDYPLVQHRNMKAPSDMKIVWIKDSFTLPLQSFLSTVFREVDVIDPRHYTDGTIIEYIEQRQPDLVVLGINPSAFGDTVFFEYGQEEFVDYADRQIILVLHSSITVDAKNGEGNYYAFEVDGDSSYKVTFDGVKFESGESESIVLALYNTVTKEVLQQGVFDIEYCHKINEFEWYFNTPETTDGELQLLFYAGDKESNHENIVIYENVELYQIQ